MQVPAAVWPTSWNTQGFSVLSARILLVFSFTFHCWSLLPQLPAGKTEQVTLHLKSQQSGKTASYSRSTSSPLCKTCHTLLTFNIQFGKQQMEKLKGLFYSDWSTATKAALRSRKCPRSRPKYPGFSSQCNMPLYCTLVLGSIETIWLRSSAQFEWEASLFGNETSNTRSWLSQTSKGTNQSQCHLRVAVFLTKIPFPSQIIWS